MTKTQPATASIDVGEALTPYQRRTECDVEGLKGGGVSGRRDLGAGANRVTRGLLVVVPEHLARDDALYPSHLRRGS